MVYFIRNALIATILIFTYTLATPGDTLYAHGGKNHSGTMVAPLTVVQKAIGLYDKLISKEKLDISWETELKSISVYQQQRGNKMEWVVKFFRTKGEPEAVYIYFNDKGEYSGSNFTGK